MKLILGLVLSSFFAVSALASAQAAPLAQNDAPKQALPEHPPTPGEPSENPKDPHSDKQSGGAIIRKEDTPVTKQPAKKQKAKKMEEKKPDPKAGQKKAVPVTPAPGESVD